MNHSFDMNGCSHADLALSMLTWLALWLLLRLNVWNSELNSHLKGISHDCSPSEAVHDAQFIMHTMCTLLLKIPGGGQAQSHL